MAVFNVNIYIETSIKGPKMGEAAGVWWVEYITQKKQEPIFRKGFLWREKTTENSLELELIRDALGILLKTCSVTVNTKCTHVLSAVKEREGKNWETEKRWVDRWIKNGWNTAKGGRVKNVEFWKQVYGEMGKHMVGFDSGHNPYQEEMLEGLQVVFGSKGQIDPWEKERK